MRGAAAVVAALIVALALGAAGLARRPKADAVCPQGVDIFDAAVFDWRFYVNAYRDLQRAGVTGEAEARAHWNTSGLGQGRWASPVFHTTQYLHLNRAAVRAACQSTSEQGTPEEALRHYLGAGRAAGLAPLTGGAWSYAAGPYGWRYTPERAAGDAVSAHRVNDSIVRFGAASRVAGALDSLAWRGSEFLVTWSRRGAAHLELERAPAAGVPLGLGTPPGLGPGAPGSGRLTSLPYDACTRCSEAGSRDDALRDDTSARLDAYKTGGDVVETRTTPAYWLGAAERTFECQTGRRGAADATQTDDTSLSTDTALASPADALCNGITIHKRVTPVGADTIRIDADARVTDGGAPAGRFSFVSHLADDLTDAYAFDSASSVRSARLDLSGQLSWHPGQALVFASVDRALGMWAPCADEYEIVPIVDGPIEAERATHVRLSRTGSLGAHPRMTLFVVLGVPARVVQTLRTLQANSANWADGASGASCMASGRSARAEPIEAPQKKRARSDDSAWQRVEGAAEATGRAAAIVAILLAAAPILLLILFAVAACMACIHLRRFFMTAGTRVRNAAAPFSFDSGG